MGERYQINLIYGTAGNKWTHHMDSPNAGGAKVLRWDLRCFDEHKPYERYQTWIDVTFKDPAGNVTKSLQLGPQDPFNCPTAGNSTRWSFKGEHVPSPLAGTMELSLRRASTKNKRTPGDVELYKDTKRLGHQVKATATATGTPDTKKVPPKPYTVYVVNKFPATKGHTSWSETTAQAEIPKQLKVWMAQVVMLKNKQKIPNSESDPLYQQPWAECVWTAGHPTAIQPDEMFVRICKFGESKFTQAQKNKAIQGGAHGMTAMIGANIHCEVWPDKLQTDMSSSKMAQTLPQLIFHEWMHFKSDANKAEDIVHARGFGYGKVPIGDDTPMNPSEQDLQFIADGLDTAFTFHPQ